MIRWALFSFVFLVLSLCALWFGRAIDFTGFEAPLVVANLTVAVLAINFSFVTHQGSDFRQFQKGLSPNLLVGCMCVLLLAMAPAMSLLFARSLVGLIALATLPLTGLSSIVLVGIAKREAAPNALIKQLSRGRRIRNALRTYGHLVEFKQNDWKKFDFAKPEDMPTHEWHWAPLPVVDPSDPISKLGAIGITSAKTGNANSFVHVARVLLGILDECHRLIHSSKQPLPASLSIIVESPFSEMAMTANEVDTTGNMTARFLDACAEYLRDKAAEEWPLANPCFFVANIITRSGRRLLAKGNASAAKTSLIMLRLLCQKGVYQWSEKHSDRHDERMESLFWPHNLSRLAAMMHPLGTAAIHSRESDYLYRVFDAFGWLGCSAVKLRNREVTTACIRALAQLGREARAQKLECHWDRCAVRPEDHARERIEWILTWMSRIEGDAQAGWIELCSQGLSRLSGRVTNITFTSRGGKDYFERGDSNDAHIEKFGSDAGYRELDYSDFTMLKDFELHGCMGAILMHGPPVPIFQSKDDADSSDSSADAHDGELPST